jgi:hypothetical protein
MNDRLIKKVGAEQTIKPYLKIDIMAEEVKATFAQLCEKVSKKCIKAKDKDLWTYDLSLTDKEDWICTFCTKTTPHENLECQNCHKFRGLFQFKQLFKNFKVPGGQEANKLNCELIVADEL